MHPTVSLRSFPKLKCRGHASAALASYPELSCGLGKTYVVRDYFDVFDEVYCPKEHTFEFLQNVLTEVMELFPAIISTLVEMSVPRKHGRSVPIASI